MTPISLAALAVWLTAAPTVADRLEAHRWNDRVIVVHDGGRPAKWVERQVQALRTHRAANAERDIVVYVCRRGACERSGGAKPVLAPFTSEALARHFRLERSTVLLVGKDGGVKLRRHRFTDVDEIHRQIDAMPMRQMEMRRRRAP